jgi:DNA-binding transcriptional LysR family regulator
MDPSLTGLRVLRAIADRGSFTAAARDLGYTQSAVSRQVAALEREAGTPLFDRAGGVRLTTEGLIMLRHARVILDEIASAERELEGEDPGVQEVRVGAFVSAGAVLLPRTLQILRDRRPEIRVLTREGTTPALVRAVRAGTIDLAVVASRPPYRPLDSELPALVTSSSKRTNLRSPHRRPAASQAVPAYRPRNSKEWIGSPARLPGASRCWAYGPDWRGAPELHTLPGIG